MATEKIVIEVDVDSTGAVQGMEELEDSTEAVGDAAEDSTGGLKKLKEGFTALNASLGIVALLVAGFVALKEAFLSSEEGQNKYNKAMAVLGSVLDNVTDVLSDVAFYMVEVFENPVESIKAFGDFFVQNITNRFKGILELIPNLSKAVGLLFEGKFKEAGKVAADSMAKVALGVEGITDKLAQARDGLVAFTAEAIKDAEIAARIADQRAEADRIERDLLVQRAEANRDIAILRDKAAQRDKFNAEERIRFLEEAARIENDITNKEIEAAKIRLEALKEENTLSNSKKEDLEEEARLTAELINLETRRAQVNRTLNTQIYTNRLEANRELAELMEEEEEEELEILVLGNEKKLDAYDEFYEELDDKLFNSYEYGRKLAEQAVEEEKNRLDFRLQMASSFLGSLGRLAEDGSKVQKAAAVAQAVVDTWRSANAAYASAASIPGLGVVAAPIAAAAAVAAGLANVKRILSVNMSSPTTTGAGAANIQTGGLDVAGSPQLVAPQFDTIGQRYEAQNDVAPVEAYVVSGNVTTAQQLDRNRIENSTI